MISILIKPQQSKPQRNCILALTPIAVMEERKLEEMPLYQKAREILEIVESIVSITQEESGNLNLIAENMLFDAQQLIPKIAGAEAVELYDLKMENAAIIRKCAREISVQCHGCIAEGFSDIQYLQILREEIDEFRVLFAEWVKTFDEWNYIIDRWGLFNPPGINYDDKDPDEDLPFNNPLQDPDGD